MMPVMPLFDRIAPVYDLLNDRLSLGQHRIWKKMAVDWGNPQPDQVWLDLCCGSGDVALLLAKRMGRGRVIGLDFSAAQLEIARNKSQGNSILSWQQGDALHMAFGAETFDGITLSYGLRNLPHFDRGLAEMHRVLKSGGRGVILDFHRPENLVMQQLQQWYLTTIVVPAAAQYQMTEEYAYLWESLQRFPQGREQVRLAQSIGFSRATHYPIVGGMMGILVVVK